MEYLKNLHEQLFLVDTPENLKKKEEAKRDFQKMGSQSVIDCLQN